MRISIAHVLCALGFAVCAAEAARGELIDISGSSSARVVQFSGLTPIQSDFEQSIIPITTEEPPVIARARLDRLVSENEIVAAGQVVALFTDPNFNAFGSPTDVGLDLGAFSDDTITSWIVEGVANETRTVRFNSGEMSAGLLSGITSSTSAESTVFLSGVLLITARDATQDLTGVAANIRIKVTKRQAGLVPEVLLEGEVRIVGGPDGTVEVSESSSAFASTFLPVVDFTDEIPDLALVRAVEFNGLQLPYQYDFVSGEQFFLDLTVTSQLLVVPGGVGAAAVFGTPMEGLASVLQRIKKDDSGQRLVDEVNRHVDTTGASYVDNPSPFPDLLGLCGTGGASATILSLAGCLLLSCKRIRRYRARRGMTGTMPACTESPGQVLL